MANNTEIPRPQWRSYYSYLLVTTGAIVGLGNIFTFPFSVATYGGLFVLFYVISELLLSVPLLFAELMIGRRGKQNPVGAIHLLAMESKASFRWRYIGWLCFFISFVTLSYYSVNVAFPLEHLFDSLKGVFSQNTVISNLADQNLTLDFLPLEICFLIFLFFTMCVIVRGINRGLEQISFITVPAYFIILFLLACYACSTGNFLSAINQLFHIPADQPLLPVFYAAFIFAFFKLNVGMGSMMVYGSYMPYSVPLCQSTVIIICLDAIASLLSYFVIAPLLLQVDSSITLSSKNILLIFSTIPHGMTVAFFFLLAAVVAAWTPSIAMAETAVLTLIERFGLTRRQSTLLISLGAVLLGTILVLSQTLWNFWLVTPGISISDFIINAASDVATPISAMLIAIFSGWIVSRRITTKELAFSPISYHLWRGIVRYLAPIAFFIILLMIA